MKINVWHGIRHDDAVVTEVDTRDRSLLQWQYEARKSGGFHIWPSGNFVPWHRVNYIEKAED